MGKSLKKFFARLIQFVQDDTGQLSSMRLLFISWGMGTLIVWLGLSIHAGTLIALPWSVVSFISSLIAGKTIQSYTEQNSSSTVITSTGEKDCRCEKKDVDK